MLKLSANVLSCKYPITFIGIGFVFLTTVCFVRQDLEGSKDYFKRRVEYVQEQIEKIEKIQLQKTRFLNSVMGVLEVKQAAAAKMIQQQQQQQPTKQGA